MDPLAAYGATLATASIVWQVFTWLHKGAKLRGYANPNMLVMGGAIPDDNTYIGLDVSNVGDAPTTITNVVLMGFPSRLARIRLKESKAAIVNHSLTQTIPYTLPAGGRFMSRVLQTPEVEQWSRDTRLYMGVCHSMRRKPFLLRVRPITPKA